MTTNCPDIKPGLRNFITVTEQRSLLVKSRMNRKDKRKTFIYSLGSSTREGGEFIKLLESCQIKCLVDVRRFLTSKFEHFKRENISKILSSAGVQYIYLGDELGGYRTGGYESYTVTENFRRGLEKLENVACTATTAVMCSERLPWKCHRRFIGNRLEERGWQVIHIIEKERVWVPKGKDKRLGGGKD